jgi:hypothetical protein
VAAGVPAEAATQPSGIYAGMGDCPLSSPALQDPANAQVGCVVAVSNSGSFTVGGTTIPFTTPLTLQFGVQWPSSHPVVKFPNGTSANVYTPVAPADGRELVASPLEVPIPGIPNILPGLTSVSAQVELAGPITSFVPLAAGQPYPVFIMPIKIHLSNPLLGPDCFIGSDSSPIVLQPTTGTTSPPPPAQPISGNPGTIGLKGDPNGHKAVVIQLTGSALVDNSFSVPGATGCGLFGILDPVVNGIFGLPSAGGKNTIILSPSDTSLAVDSSISDLSNAIAASEK